MRRAVILSSGGIDSTVCLAIAKQDGYELYSLTINYGQRHWYEIEAAQKIAQYFQVKQHKIISLDLSVFGGSALTTQELDIPKGQAEKDNSSNIPITYVPARNTIFLALALAWAEVLGAESIFLGANYIDYSGYPDCRPEYIQAFEKMACLATKAGVEKQWKLKILTPVISLTKGQIIKKGIELGVDFAITHSCYDPDSEGRPCGQCDSCYWRLKGFQEAGITDPLPYPPLP
jgi:7-cyano-7-deazaguanine synthase